MSLPVIALLWVQTLKLLFYTSVLGSCWMVPHLQFTVFCNSRPPSYDPFVWRENLHSLVTDCLEDITPEILFQRCTHSSCHRYEFVELVTKQLLYSSSIMSQYNEECLSIIWEHITYQNISLALHWQIASITISLDVTPYDRLFWRQWPNSELISTYFLNTSSFSCFVL
jgi:hypothetical protein